MKKIIQLLSLLLPLALVLSACSDGAEQSQPKKDKLTIYTTVFPLQYFTERIGGNLVDVKTIYPPGADEHTFEPSQKDMMNLADSDLFFYIGLGLEGFVEKAKGTLKNENVKLVSVADQLQLPKEDSTLHEEEDDDHEHHSDVNPHVWLDPIYSKEMAAVIRDRLTKEMPKNKDLFEANYQKLATELDELNTQYQQTISTAKHKKIIVTHAAFGYWEKRYGIEQISISGLSTTNEPTQKELEKIISVADHDGLHYILFEQNVQSKLGKVVQKEIGARALPIHNLGILSKNDIKNKETYFTLMAKNLDSLKTALNN
ncbi:zinc transport system substrate-binding protein [Bacillus sp. SLBN-46]|jgi:zinc transport system substrate-binding protein|uniref:metal ABC transporter solute-binding protein, Zn/Mn family n=1 Tax=Bacillus sp. SLBN-46 TaxID=3042283 RepID=UPI002858749F|nr:zinc ABC transporter substrate-binding protein [Bacillus sp. SLBN-46]MDR6121983.1 zinc transport system substrate-binding protein [Bacillus sp. SLBN-46]